MTILFCLQTVPSAADQISSMNGEIVQYIEVLLTLGGICVLAYLTLRIGLPRLMGMKPPGSGPIQVVARYPLEPKKTLYLVKAGSQMFLIGTSESQVEYLTAVADENATEIVESVRLEAVPRRDFRQLLSRLQKGREG